MSKVLFMFVVLGSVISRCEGDNSRFDAVHGDRVDIVMQPVGDVAGRCRDMGGELIAHVGTIATVYVCQDVDF